jgi:hypothetical protein
MERVLGGPQNRFRYYRGLKGLLPLPGIEHKFLGPQSHSLIAIGYIFKSYG